MSDNKNPTPPQITDIEGTYNYRLKYKSNDEPYYYIKEYESDMKWYKKYIIISVIILIIFIALIITGFITSDVIFIVIGFIFGGISGFVLWYFITEYNQNKENRDRNIKNAKHQIEKEINDIEENKRKEIEKANAKTSFDEERKIHIENLTKERSNLLNTERERIKNKILQIINDNKDNEDNKKTISGKIIYAIFNSTFSDDFFKNNELLMPVITEDNKEIINQISQQIKTYNDMNVSDKADYRKSYIIVDTSFNWFAENH